MSYWGGAAFSPNFSILYETSDTWNTTGTGSVPCLDESQATIISLQSPWIKFLVRVLHQRKISSPLSFWDDPPVSPCKRGWPAHENLPKSFTRCDNPYTCNNPFIASYREQKNICSKLHKDRTLKTYLKNSEELLFDLFRAYYIYIYIATGTEYLLIRPTIYIYIVIMYSPHHSPTFPKDLSFCQLFHGVLSIRTQVWMKRNWCWVATCSGKILGISWVISHVPIFHITQPLGIWSINV